MIKSSILHKTSDGKEFRGMKHSIKKGISLVLALSLCVSLGMESALALTPQPSSAGAAAQNTSAEQAPIETVSDAADITAMVQNYWEDSFFEEVVINPNRETVTKDGTETTLEQALDLSHAEAEAVLESPNAAADYFSNSVYDSQTTEDGQVVIKAPFQTMRIILYADTLSDTYGAVEALHSPDYDEYILQYDSQEAAQTAYDKLAEEHGQDHCFVDQLITQDDLLMDTGTSGAASCYSWGATLMGLDQLKAQAGNAVGDSSVTVAVLDTGFDAEHTFFEQHTISPDSYNFMDNSTDISDVTGHGTHVAGIIADCTPANISFLLLRVFSLQNVDGTEQARSTTLVVNTALQYAVEQRADVINMSFGWNNSNASSYTFLDETITAAYQAGIPICCAAGNESDDVKTSYPACNKNTIAVSSVNEDGSFDTVYSNYGSGIDFAAPGVDIVSAKSGGGVCTKTGTSMATPHLTAAISYIKLRAPSSTVADVYEVLQRYAIDAGTPGRDKLYGWGYVDLSTYFRDNPGGSHDLSAMTATLSHSSYTCDGTAKRPAVTVWENGAAVPEHNYTVSYQNNRQVGTASVTITGVGNYRGSITKSFSIKLGAAAISSAANGITGITVTWRRVPGASGYCIYRQTGASSSWKKVKTMDKGSSVNWTDTKVSNGASYRYLVRPYCGKTSGTYKGSKTVYRLTRTSLSSAKNSASRKLSLAWKRNNRASGYQLQYATNSRFRSPKTVTVKSGKTVTQTLSRLKKGKQYYVRVRCYKTVSGGRSYSAWSIRKVVKIKR